MAGTRVQEMETLLELQDKALSCNSFEDIRHSILAPTTDYVDADTSCFLQFVAAPDNRVRVGRNVSHNVPEKAHANYISHYFEADPAVEESFGERNTQPYIFCTSDIYDYKTLTASPFYNEFFRPNNIHHVMIMALCPDISRDDVLVVGYHRPASAPAFGDAAKRRVRNFAPVISCALRSMCLQDALAIRDETVNEYEDAYPGTGLALFDENMSLVYGNHKGLTDLQLGSHCDSPAQTQSRLECIARACQALYRQPHGHDSLKTDFSEGENLVAMVRKRQDPLGRTLFAVHTNDRTAEAVFITRCKEFDMTNREVDIIRLLAAGLSNGEIAERLFISIRTVENHLRSTYSKAGVSRRTQLLHRLMSY